MLIMVKRLRKHFNFLKKLKESPPKERCDAISNCSGDQLKVLLEIVKNLLKGNIPITKIQKTKLQKYRKQLRKLSDSRTSMKKKKRLFTQKGGIIPLLPLLLGPALSMIGGIGGKAIGTALGL